MIIFLRCVDERFIFNIEQFDLDIVHWLLTVPHNPERIKDGKNKIMKVASTDGYGSNLVDRIIRKKLYKCKLLESSIFIKEKQDSKFRSVPNNILTIDFNKYFGESNLRVYYIYQILFNSY